MRLGYFTQPVHPPAKDYRQVLSEDREAILLADRLGYVEAFLGEQITDRGEPMRDVLKSDSKQRWHSSSSNPAHER